MRTVKTLIRLGRCPVWSESSLGAHVILLVLSCCGSFVLDRKAIMQNQLSMALWQWKRMVSKCVFLSVLKFEIISHTCHKLWTEICEIRQIFRWDLIKFCEIFTKITLMLPQSSQKPLFICKKLVKKQQSVIYVYFFIKCVVRWNENSVRFANLMGISFQMGQILWDFISQCEAWHIWFHNPILLHSKWSSAQYTS